MKKSALFALFASLVLILSGCGSNDKIDGGSSAANKSITLGTSFSRSGQDFNISMKATKGLPSDYKVELKNFKLVRVGGCEVSSVNNPDPILLTGGVGSSANIQFSGTFKKSCTPGDYTIEFSQITTKGDRSKVETVTFDSSAPSGGGGSGGGSTPADNGFFNAITPMQITQANHDYEIKIQVIEDGYLADGKVVKVKPFDSKYGTISNPTATTSGDGYYAVFNYKSPAVLPANGTTATIQLTHDNNGTVITQDIVLEFSSSSVGGSQYSLINETSIVATAPNTKKEITAHLIDANTGIGVSGKDVSITTIPSIYGAISASTVQTDAGGKATFEYTSPATLTTGSTNATLSFTDENGVTISKIVTITTVPPAGGGGAQYRFINATNLTVTAANTPYQLSVDLVDATGVGVSGKEVSITAISNTYGDITPSKVTTNASGRAIFTYTSPASLVSGSATTTVRFTDENANTITKDIVITVSSSGSSVPYNIINTTTPIVVNYDSEIKTISAVVVDGSGVGVKDIDVSITAVSGVQYGAITSASTAKTDQSGRAIFTYKAPGDVASVNNSSTSIKLFLKEYPTVEQSVAINFDKTDTNVTMPIVVLANTYKEVNLTQNSQNAQIEVQVFEQGTNTPYTSGNVQVTLPDNVLNGVDVGSFTEYKVAVGSNGKALFNYTGPQDLQALIDANETNTTFKFFHEANPTQTEVSTVLYNLQAGYIPANYLLTTSSTDGKQTMNLNKVKTFTLYLKDDQGTLVDNNKINTITITSKNTIIGKLINPNTSAEVPKLVFNGSNANNGKSFNVKTNTLSGLLPIEIKVDFINASNDDDNQTTTMNIVVFSGPPTAMSISYAGVEHNSTVAKYTEKFVVTVTDTYNNPVNTKPFIATGAIVEYAVDGSSASGTRTTTSPRLWHGTSDPRGELEAIGGNKAQFTTTSNAFNYIDINNDRLVVFGAGYVYEALGKWDLESVAPQLLELKDDYYGTTRSDLGFAVGHNNRQDLCSGDQREYVGNMKSDTYQIDENGHALIEFEYDYHLTGKDIMVWVNLTGFQADNNKTGRIGEAQKHTLRGNGLVPVPENGYTVPKGTSRTGSFAIHHENAPEWYKNGKFGWAVKAGSNCGYTIDSTSNLYDARSCYGAAYINFTLTAPADKDCTFAIERIQTAREFTGVNTH